MICVLVWFFFESIFLFSPFSAETKLLPPVMDGSVIKLFFVKNKTRSPAVSVLFNSSHTNQKVVLKDFYFFRNQNILLQKAGIAICFSFILFHKRADSDTCDI